MANYKESDTKKSSEINKDKTDIESQNDSIRISIDGAEIFIEISILRQFYNKLNYGGEKVPEGEFENFLDYAKIYFPLGIWGIDDDYTYPSS